MTLRNPRPRIILSTVLSSDAKQLREDEKTGARTCEYVRTGDNHYSMAFTFDCLAAYRAARSFYGWLYLDDD